MSAQHKRRLPFQLFAKQCSLPCCKVKATEPATFQADIYWHVLPCCREKLQACEGKLRSAVQDKANALSEKAAIDRQLKALQAQTGKLTKVST